MLTRRAALAGAGALALAPPARAASQERPLVFLGDRNLPPYEFLEDGQPRGASVDLVRAIGRVLGRPVEVRLMDWAEAQARLLAGEGDALTLLARSPGREAHFDFSRPTLPGNSAFFVHAGREREFVERDRLPGWRIAATRGGLARELLAASHPEAEIVPVADLAEGIAMLRAARVDAVAGNAWTIRRLLLAQDADGIVELPPFTRQSGNIAVRAGETALLAEIDRALVVLKENGELDAIMNRWSHARVHVFPDWMVRTAIGVGVAAAVVLGALAALALRLRARTSALTREIHERSRAEAALAQREGLLAAIGESTPDLIFAKDAEGRLRYANPAALRVSGRSFAETEGLNVADWIEDADRVRMLQDHDRRVMERGVAETFSEPAPDATRGGEVRMFMTTKSPLRDPGGRVVGIVGVAHDVTEAHAARLALEEAKQRLEIILDGAGLGTWHWRVPEDHCDYDARWLAALGYAPNAIDPRREGWRRLIHPDDLPAAMAAMQAHLDGATPVLETEYRLRRRDGSWIWVLSRGRVMDRDARGRPLLATGTFLDVTARKEAEAALAESRERFALASAAAELGVWDVDVAARTAVVNREFLRLYGLPEEGPTLMSQQAWLARVHPEDRPRVEEVARRLHAQGGEYREEYRVLRADTGAVRWLGVRGSAMGHPGQVRRVVGVCLDITERRQEQERQLLLAREVDHRARNVLAVVQSVVRLTRAEDPRDFADAVEGRVAALARAHSLLSRDRWTGADLAELVREELAAYGQGASAALAGPPLRLEAGAVQPLSMVMHELATNAAKYGALSVPGGQVRVEWELRPGGDGRQGVWLRWLERHGPRLPAPPSRRGFGSSLIAVTVRGQLGGRIGQHWEAEGLRCEIELPATVLAEAGPVAAAAEEAAGEAPQAPLYGRRVLLVEDEPLVGLALQSVLQDAGCTVRGPVATLAEAQRVGAEEGLDAAVMDVNVGGGVSVPLGERLTARGVPVVYVTGMGTLPGGRAPGPLETVLQKPVGDRALVEALARAVGAAVAG